MKKLIFLDPLRRRGARRLRRRASLLASGYYLGCSKYFILLPLINFRRIHFLNNNFQKSCKIKYLTRHSILFWKKISFRKIYFFEIFLEMIFWNFRKKSIFPERRSRRGAAREPPRSRRRFAVEPPWSYRGANAEIQIIYLIISEFSMVYWIIIYLNKFQ